ncbi:MAG: AbrB/MazE/SpoVT family DNA-binding domain-containing protein [Promethearchaeota archaeon]
MIDETRKVTQWGKSKTLVVSLPRRWIKKFGIEPDSQLHIHEDAEGSLRITPLQMVETPSQRVATVRLLEQDEMTLRTILETYYIVGYDQLTIESSRRLNESVRKTVTNIVNQLPGFEILEVTDRRIVIKGVSVIRGQDIMEFVKMSGGATLESIKTLIKGLEAGPDETARVANELITEEWRQRGNYLRAKRSLRKAMNVRPPGFKLDMADIFDTSYFVMQLNSIHDNVHHIAEALTRRQPTREQNKLAVAALTKVYDNLQKAISAFLQRNQEMVRQVLGEIPLLRQWKRQTETIVDVMRDSVITQIILDRMEEMLAYNSGIAKTALLLKT